MVFVKSQSASFSGKHIAALSTVAAHIICLAVFLVMSLWHISMLKRPTLDSYIVFQTPLSSAPRAQSNGSPKKLSAPKKQNRSQPSLKKKVNILALASPTDNQDTSAHSQGQSDDSSSNGFDVGMGLGGGGGCLVEDMCDSLNGPVESTRQESVSIKLLQTKRISGNTNIQPTPAMTRTMNLSGGGEALVQFCVEQSGKTSMVKIKKTSGSKRYDEKLRKEIRLWLYSPFQLNGRPIRACSTITFKVR